VLEKEEQDYNCEANR
jgi:hypothetical protein